MRRSSTRRGQLFKAAIPGPRQPSPWQRLVALGYFRPGTTTSVVSTPCWTSEAKALIKNNFYRNAESYKDFVKMQLCKLLILNR